MQPFQQPFAKPLDFVAGWQLERPGVIGFKDVVRNARPTILIGASGQPATFTEEIVREMAKNVERPVIFPLSNPTAFSEANPGDLIQWTEGRALVATGSPFADDSFQGRTIRIAQCNNSYIFPAMGLAVLASGARRVTDAMFMAAARALAECSPARGDPFGPLLPPMKEIRRVARSVALAAAAEAQRAGVAEATSRDGSSRPPE